MKRLLTVIAMLLLVTPLFAQESLTPQQRLKLLPLPPGVTTDTQDISASPLIDFAQKHNEFFMLDPFVMERNRGSIPAYESLHFTSASSPREIFLFFKKFFNTEEVKPRTARTLPYYGTRSYYDFDPIGDASVSRNPAAVGGAVYYKIMVQGEPEGVLDICIFNAGTGKNTDVFIVAYNKPPRPGQ